MPGTVTVACKLPNGLHLRLFNMETYNEPVMGGGTREAKRAVQNGGRVTLNGFSHRFDKAPEWGIVGGYGITHGVDADFFKEWVAQNADSNLVKNKIVFAHGQEASIKSMAVEHKAVKSGMERLDPDNLPTGILKGTR